MQEHTSRGAGRLVCIVNPRSANGRTGKQWPAIQQRLAESFTDVESWFTQGPGHASDLARRAVAEEAPTLVSVGGDGTLNEVVNGLMAGDNGVPPAHKPAVGIIPRGTGGDYRKTFGFGLDLNEAVQRIARGQTRMVDAARMQAHDLNGAPVVKWYINIMSFGMSGMVDHLCNTTTKALGGKASFLMASVRALRSYRNQAVRIRLDDNPPFETTLRIGALAVGRYFGGGMMFAPNADPSDGLFDVVLMGDVSRWEMATQGSLVYQGEHIRMDKVKVFRARHVTAEPLDPHAAVLIDMDGETPGKLPIDVACIPGAVRLLV